MTAARSVDELLKEIDGLLDRRDRLARIDQRIATERDSGRRASWRILRRLEQEDDL